MTVASECVVAGELGLRYAAICVVDNLANGVADKELTLARDRAQPRGQPRSVQEAIAAILPALGGGGGGLRRAA